MTKTAYITTALLAFLTGPIATSHGADDRPPPLEVPGPLVGSIELTNERERPVQIYIDGRFATELRARSTDVIERVPNGVRLVSYAGLAGRDGVRWQTDRVEVREGRRAALRIAPLRGHVSISNQAGIAMQVTIGVVDLGVLEPGRELVSPPLAEGSHRVAASPIGWGRAKPQIQEVIVTAGMTVRAEIRPYAATLVVSNPFPRAVTVWLDGRRVGRLERLQSKRIGRLEPGRVLAELRADVRVLASEVVDLTAGRETYFAPQPSRHGRLEVRNPTREPVRITIDGLSGFRLLPGAVRVIDDLPAGPLTIQLTTDDGRIVRHEAQIVGGEINRFLVPQAWVSEPGGVPVRPRPR